jgi:hypothetical protein
VAYSDPLFRATVDVARHFTHSGRLRGLFSALSRKPITFFQVLFAIARLPIVEVSVTDGQAAALLARDFAPIDAPIFGGRYAQAVLDLGPDDQAYLAGRRRQAVRTNMRHARNFGVEVTRVAGYEEWSAATCAVLRSRPDGVDMIDRLRPPPPTQDMVYFVAVDDRGHPVAISVVAGFDQCAVLVWSLSVPGHPAASSSRYLLHTFMRSELRRRGMRHFIAGTGVRDTPGLQYFQHLLGYELRNVRVRVRRASAAALDPCGTAGDEVVMSSALG